MEDMQAKLEQYRLRKRRKEKFDTIKEKIKNFLMPGSNKEESKEIAIRISERTTESTSSVKFGELDDNTEAPETPSESSDEVSDLSPPKSADSKLFKYTLRVVYFLFWTTLYIIAIELKFGIVFLMFSALVGIYLNTRTGPRKNNEISAYSVFNKNCESIDGTLKAEQFERDLFFRADIQK